MSATLDETRKLAPAVAGRWTGDNLNESRRCAPREGEPSLHFRFAFLPSEAARLRHGQHKAISRPGSHRADTCTRAKSPHCSPRAAGRTRQLCNRSTPFHFSFTSCASVPLRSDGHKLPRPSKTAAHLKCKMAARLRPARNNSPRVVARGQGNSNTARGSACRRG